MPIKYNDTLESNGRFPLVDADQLGNVVTDVTLSGNTLRVTKKDGTNKYTSTPTDTELPGRSENTGLTSAEVEDFAETSTPNSRIPRSRFSDIDQNILGALSGIGISQIDAADGGVLAVQSSRTNISIATTANGVFSQNHAVSAQVANPWVMVAVRKTLSDSASKLKEFEVLLPGGIVTPTLDSQWTVVPGITTGVVANFNYYEIQLSGQTVSAGTAQLDKVTEIDDRLLPTEFVTDLVADWAEDGNTSDVPTAKLPNASATTAGIITATEYAKFDEGGGLTEVASDSTLTGTGAESSPLSVQMPFPGFTDHQENVFRAFTGGGWANSTTGQIAYRNDGAGNQPIRYNPGSPPSLAVARVQLYTATPDDISPAQTNGLFVYRIPFGSTPNAWRVMYGDTGDERITTAADSTLLGSDPDSVSPRYTYYHFTDNANIPEGAQLRVQELDPFELSEYVNKDDIFPDGGDDGDLLTLTNAQNRTRAWRPARHVGGLRLLMDNHAGGNTIGASSDHEGQAVQPTPVFDMTDESGVLFIDVRWVISGATGTNASTVAFNSTTSASAAILESERTAEVHVPRILAQSAYLRGGAREGLALAAAEVDIYRHGVNIGTAEAWVAKEGTTDNFIAYWYYDGEPAGAGTTFTLTPYWTVSYLPLGGAAFGGGGASGSLNTEQLGTAVTISNVGNSTWSDWTDIFSFTVPSGEDGIYHYEYDTHMTNSGVGSNGRMFVEERVMRTRSSVETILTTQSIYIRNSTNDPDDNSRYHAVGAWDDADVGDVVKLQGRARIQANWGGTGTVTWDTANNRASRYKSP